MPAATAESRSIRISIIVLTRISKRHWQPGHYSVAQTSTRYRLSRTLAARAAYCSKLQIPVLDSHYLDAFGRCAGRSHRA